MENKFEGSVGARDLIQLPTMNDPRLGGRESPRRWWGFASKENARHGMAWKGKE
jgi:hypothetical protein